MAPATSQITTLLNPDDLPAGIDPVEARTIVLRSMNVATEFGAAGINVEHSLVDAALIARAREVGLGVWVFIVGDAERFAELIDMGVTAMTTNRPARMLAMVGSRSSAAPKETDT